MCKQFPLCLLTCTGQEELFAFSWTQCMMGKVARLASITPMWMLACLHAFSEGYTRRKLRRETSRYPCPPFLFCIYATVESNCT